MTAETQLIIIQALALIATSVVSVIVGWVTKKKLSKRTGKAINEIVKDVIKNIMPHATRLKSMYQGKLPKDNARWLQSDARIAIKKECHFKGFTPPPDENLNEMIEGKLKTIKREQKLPPLV